MEYSLVSLFEENSDNHLGSLYAALFKSYAALISVNKDRFPVTRIYEDCFFLDRHTACSEKEPLHNTLAEHVFS